MGPCFCDSPTWKLLSGLQRLIVVPLLRPLPCGRSYTHANTHSHSGLVALCSQIVTICISVIKYVVFTIDPSLNRLFAVCCLHEDHEDWASVASQQGCGQSQCNHSRPLRPDSHCWITCSTTTYYYTSQNPGQGVIWRILLFNYLLLSFVFF